MKIDLEKYPDVESALKTAQAHEPVELYYNSKRVGEIHPEIIQPESELATATRKEWPQAKHIIEEWEKRYGPLHPEDVDHIKYGPRRLGFGPRVHIPDEAFAPLTDEELKDWGLD